MAARAVGPVRADDIAQEALLRAWRHRSSCRTPERPWAWLRTIVQREIAREMVAPRALLEAEGDDIPTEDERLRSVCLHADVRAAVDGLDARCRSLIILHHYCDMSVAAIATELDIPEGTVKVTLMRARAKLRSSLEADAAD